MPSMFEKEFNNMKKVIIALSIVLSLSMVLAGCSSAPATPAPSPEASPIASPEARSEVSPEVSPEAFGIPEFSLAIEGVENVPEFTNINARQLEIKELATSVTNKNGETTESVYTGVLLKDLLAEIGVTDLTTLTIEASDGYQVKYDKAMAFSDDVIVGWLKDGKPMENNQIDISPAKAGGKTLAKMAEKLIVE